MEIFCLKSIIVNPIKSNPPKVFSNANTQSTDPKQSPKNAKNLNEQINMQEILIPTSSVKLEKNT